MTAHPLTRPCAVVFASLFAACGLGPAAHAVPLEVRTTLDFDSDGILNADDAFPTTASHPGDPGVDDDGDGLFQPDDPDDSDAGVPSPSAASDFDLGPDKVILVGGSLMLDMFWSQTSAAAYLSVNFSSTDLPTLVASASGAAGGAVQAEFDGGDFAFLSTPGVYTLTGTLVGVGLSPLSDTVTVTVASEIPLPAPAALLLGAIGGLTLLRRRQG